jgi:hypothetical protein
MKSIMVIVLILSLAFSSPLIVSAAQKGWKTYTVDDKYSFQYPSNWKLEERQNRFTAVDAKITYGNNVAQMAIGGGGHGYFKY